MPGNRETTGWQGEKVLLKAEAMVKPRIKAISPTEFSGDGQIGPRVGVKKEEKRADSEKFGLRGQKVVCVSLGK